MRTWVCAPVPLCPRVSARRCLCVGPGPVQASSPRRCTPDSRPCMCVRVPVRTRGRRSVPAVTPRLPVRGCPAHLPAPHRPPGAVRGGEAAEAAALPGPSRRCSLPSVPRFPAQPAVPAPWLAGMRELPRSSGAASTAVPAAELPNSDSREDVIGASAIGHRCLHGAPKMSARGCCAQREGAQEGPGGPEGKGRSLPRNATLHLQEQLSAAPTAP
ncbi:uncharacterized protein LOC135411997 [Pseudopipra pipra]|uniref:uncharacterized protein LOC135411997 n=1 Tax=Pseudopipra pipra TaxID=415032 RepID=UPI003138D280